MKALTADEHTRLETLMRATEPINRSTESERKAALEACLDIFVNFSALAYYVATKTATRGRHKEAYHYGVTASDLRGLEIRAPFGVAWEDMEAEERERAWAELGFDGAPVPVDLLGEGTGDRLEFGMLARRVKARKRKG